MKTVILNFGYAESAMVSQVTMSTYYLGDGKDFSPQEGMMSLAMDFYHYHLNMTNSIPGETSADDFASDCIYLAVSDTDKSWWDEQWDNLEKEIPPPIWSPFWAHETLPDLKSGNFIYIPERAEYVLLDLILQSNPKAFSPKEYNPSPLNIRFTDADLGNAFRVPWGK
jgi:hypothetical protein